MLVRKATRNDAAAIADCLFLAMKEIVYIYIGDEDAIEAKRFLKQMAERSGNQYAYEFCWVVENENGQVIAAANIYDGANLKPLRRSVKAYLSDYYQTNLPPLGDETEPGEMYIDCIGVLPNQQGKGLGTILLKHLIAHYCEKNHQILGLLVDNENPNAEKLYQRLGFEVVKTKRFAGKDMKHMQYKNV